MCFNDKNDASILSSISPSFRSVLIIFGILVQIISYYLINVVYFTIFSTCFDVSQRRKINAKIMYAILLFFRRVSMFFSGKAIDLK
jgi:hypothetical protein